MSAVQLDYDGDVAVITLSNPPVNAVSKALFDDYTKTIRDVAASSARAMLTRAEGDNFSAGADPALFADLGYVSGSSLVAELLASIHMLESLPIPTVCAVQGMCVAAGMEIMLAHDLAIVTEEAMLGQVEARLGTATLGGGAQRIAARAGIARAKEMVFTGGLYPAQTCFEWGIVNKVVKSDALSEKAIKMAKRLAAAPTVAIAADKAALNAFVKSGLQPADAAMIGASGATFASQDMQTGLQAFATGGAAALMQSLPFKGQ